MESRAAYRVQLAELVEQLDEMCSLAASAMERATMALLCADLALAEQVITDVEEITTRASHAREDAFAVLALQSPVAGDLRAVVSAIPMAAAIDRMGALALQIAKIVRQRHPQRALPDDVVDIVAEIGGVAVRLGHSASEALLSRDAARAADIRRGDEVVDDLLQHLFAVVVDRRWRHGVSAAVDVTLLGRCYERFADHAAEVAQGVIFQATGTVTGGATSAHSAEPEFSESRGLDVTPVDHVEAQRECGPRSSHAAPSAWALSSPRRASTRVRAARLPGNAQRQ